MLKNKKIKSKTDLDFHSKSLKKRKKHKGKPSGSRFNLDAIQRKKAAKKVIDERLGSKKPIALVIEESTQKQTTKPKATQPKVKKTRQDLMAELQALEQNDYFNLLIDKVEAEQSLTAQEEVDFNKMMDKLEWLIEKLDIQVNDDIETDDEEENNFDIMHLLR